MSLLPGEDGDSLDAFPSFLPESSHSSADGLVELVSSGREDEAAQMLAIQVRPNPSSRPSGSSVNFSPLHHV
jgi:hypothetical protein